MLSGNRQLELKAAFAEACTLAKAVRFHLWRFTSHVHHSLYFFSSSAAGDQASKKLFTFAAL